ncbi:MAG: hypothetical protein NTV80_15435 [Verrucomicrobia bacterium]|nr:hypothetical protein [Verrucomicrobiota bacterium]
MRRSWIKIETNTPDKPEVCMIASQLRMDSDAVMGKLVRLWAWAELNVSSANDTSVTLEFLDKVVGRKGFSAALIKAGWLIQKEDRIEFPNFSRHNGREAKGRAQTALRVSRHRAQKAKGVPSGAANQVTEEPPMEVPQMTAVEHTASDTNAQPEEHVDTHSSSADVSTPVDHSAESDSEPQAQPVSDTASSQELSVTEAATLIAETLALQEVKPPTKKRRVQQSQEEELQLLF